MKRSLDISRVRTWIEVGTQALQHNYTYFRQLIPDQSKLLAVAKSNAYGHGLFDYAKEIERLGADWIGVDSITEAFSLRKTGIKIPILVLGYTLPAHLPDALAANISLTVSTFESLGDLARLQTKKHFKIHLKIDTGMHRQGFYLDQLPKVIDFIKTELPHVEIEGLYTHFAIAKDPNDRDFTNKQIAAFKQAIDAIKAAGYNPICHASATAGTLNFPKAHFDMVRVGIGLMGLWPSEEQKNKETKIEGSEGKNKILKPALSWRTIISEVKTVAKGESVSYDLTETLQRDSVIAILPIGYWHGFPRSLSSVGQVLIDGKRCKVLGRVCMDMIVVDVTDINQPRVGKIATLIGKDGNEEITAYEVAKTANLSHYELVTRLNPLIKKYYYEGE